VPNANYLWINLFATSLNDHGRAALVMANSASDARHSEADIRRTLIEHNLISGMLTLPSNMFYTVTLPATLWFFDKAKGDDRILFIDSRTIFTQIDRAHREFSEEQINNLAAISHLRHGKGHKFVRLIDRYFEQGMAKLRENKARVGPVAEQLLTVLDNGVGKRMVADLLGQWSGLTRLQARYGTYLANEAGNTAISKKNAAQHGLRQDFDPFFSGLHQGLKELAKVIRSHEKVQAEAAKQTKKRLSGDRQTKGLNAALDALLAEVKEAESFFKHIHWLQERFPQAEYEDVTGLCKLATMAEVKEQDWSLNPGRYVGVVIEEDGKTEEEFVEELLAMNDELAGLNGAALGLGEVIAHNIKQIAGG
jgi:type I restriction enzyme M protein